MIVIENKFEFGDTVYLLTDKDQIKRIITAMSINPGGTIRYCLANGVGESWHYDFEVSTEIDVLQTTTC